MAESADPNLSISGNLLFYRTPQMLSKETHAKLGISPSPARYGFANKAHMCPLTVSEFGPSALSYPIIFLGEQHAPAAVFGLQEGQNLFTTGNDEGFENEVYVPSYIRRYPFVLAAGPNPDDQMMVCIDRAYEYIVEKADYPFFENGEPSTFTKNCIEFCNEFEQQNRLTQQFSALLTELDVFDNRTATYQPTNSDGTPNGDIVTFAQYTAVSEEKLKALPEKTILELYNTGALQQIHVHLNSLFNWERLLLRADKWMKRQQPVAANA